VITHKLFIKLILLFTLIAFLIFGTLNYFLYKVPQNTLWINNSFVIKDNYAKSINIPKIVFTGGSSVLYGVNTIDIEKELNTPTVNMAIHAGLQADYIIHRAKSILKSGDIVILSFEYEALRWNGEQNPARTDYILTHDKMYFNNMNFYEQLSMIYSINSTDLFKSIIQQIKTPVKLVVGKNVRGYNADSLNINGDETYKNGIRPTVSDYNHIPFPLHDLKETIGLSKIKDFSLWCKNNNIKLFITYPNMINQEEYYQDSYLNYFRFLKGYFNDNDIKVIGSPHDAMYPLKYFYDTSYHMNEKGSQIRTKNLIKRIKPIIPINY
jgi:hypothetical protein